MRVESRLMEYKATEEEVRTNKIICQSTKRIMIISESPERVRHMLVTLTSACYDVFSLHRLEGNMLQAFQPDLLIYDGSYTAQSDREQLLRQTELLGTPVLMLLDQQSYESYSNYARGAELLQWPTRTELAMHRIQWMMSNKPKDKLPLASEDIRIFKDIYVDLKRMTVDLDGRRIELTKTEYDMLLYFIASDGSVLSRDSLLDAIWGVQFFGGSNVVDVHIKSLRKKLKDSAVSPKYIVTVRGVGYRLADHRDGRKS